MTAAAIRRYVALGDSISTDDYPGPDRGGAALLHRNHPDFPAWAGRDLVTRFPGCVLGCHAVDGGTTHDVLEVQLPALAEGSPPDLITLTVGGNDFLGMFGMPEAEARRAVTATLARLDEILGRIQTIAPRAIVGLGTIYDPSDETGDLGSVSVADWPPGPACLAALNAGIVAATRRAGATLVDIHARFLGHGRRAGSVDGSPPGPVDGDVWYCRAIEPNRRGAHEVRALFWDSLGLPR